MNELKDRKVFTNISSFLYTIGLRKGDKISDENLLISSYLGYIQKDCNVNNEDKENGEKDF